METNRENHRRVKSGVVTSDKMQKTIVVRVERKYRHAMYGKIMSRAKKFKVHDEKNEAKAGDLVEIQETRPLSREKRWRLLRVLRQGVAPKTAAEIAAGEILQGTDNKV